MLHVVVQRADVHKALAMAQSIVERKTTMPILSNILLSAKDGNFKISATDLEIASVIKVPGKIKGQGSLTVNGKILSELVKELGDGDIEFRVVEGARLKISSNRSELNIVGVSAEEYPSLPGVSLDTKGKISASLLQEMIQRTLYCVSADETRFNLTGVCFEWLEDKKSGSQLRLAATDGHRLAAITRPVSGLSITERVIVPKKGLQELRRLLEEQVQEEIGFSIQEGFMVVETNEAKMSVRLIDGEFPDYHQVIPKDPGSEVRVRSADLAQALRRVSLVIPDKIKGVEFNIAQGGLKISSSSSELGDAKEELIVDYAGEPIRVGFNARYVLDLIQSFGEESTLVMDLHGEVGPGRFFTEQDRACIAIVMPMRLG